MAQRWTVGERILESVQATLITLKCKIHARKRIYPRHRVQTFAYNCTSRDSVFRTYKVRVYLGLRSRECSLTR